MKPETLRNLYETELERLAAILPKSEPGSEEYSRIFYIMGDIEFKLDRLSDQVEVDSDTAAPAPAPVVEPTPVADTPAPVVEAIAEEPKPNDGEYINPEELRAYLAEAKKKGVVIADLIASLGAANFSGLRDDQSKLRQLKLLAEAAILTVAAGKV